MEERKTRRNKRIMIVAAILLLLVAIFCIGGVTYAKYITKNEASTDQVTVAKWGYVVTVNADDMFGDAYKEDGGKSVVEANRDGAVSVLASTEGTKVVAPGTTGSMTITVKGQAEVTAKITIADKDGVTTSDVSLKYGDDEADVYNPVKWTLKKSVDGAAAADVTGAVDVTLDELLTVLKADVGTQTIRAGESIDVVYTISWEWAFETGADADAKNLNNTYDTVLGDAAAMDADAFADKYKDGEGNPTYVFTNAKTTIEFGFVITVEQTQDNVAPTPAP